MKSLVNLIKLDRKGGAIISSLGLCLMQTLGFSQAVSLQGVYNCGNNYCDHYIILNADSTFTKFKYAGWDGYSKAWLFKTSWKRENENLVLEWGLIFQKTKKLEIIKFDEKIFLIPKKDVDLFNQLIKEKPKDYDEKLILQERILSFLHKEP